LLRYSQDQTQQFYKKLMDRASQAAGVMDVALTSGIPMSPGGLGQTAVVPEGYDLPKGKESIPIFSNIVGGRFFDAMDVTILRGRAFCDSDTESSPKVAVVNEAFANKYWPNKDAVGQRFRLEDSKGPWVQIVGVARTSKYLFITEPPIEFLYLPLAQRPQTRMTLLVHSAGDPRALVTPVREAIRGIDANQPIYGVRTMEDFFTARAVNTTNYIVETVGGLGLMGLVLAMVGLYGLVAYSVSRRVREYGIRMAIGAQSGQVLRMVLKQGLVLSLTGIGIGSVASLGAGGVLRAAFGSANSTPSTYVIVPLLLVFITMLAALAPALRAAKIDPMKALREE
jgi:predicted permease